MVPNGGDCNSAMGALADRILARVPGEWVETRWTFLGFRLDGLRCDPNAGCMRAMLLPAMNPIPRLWLILWMCLGWGASLSAVPIRWSLQTRDPQSGEVRITHEVVDSSRIGVVAVDIWNYHWCKTATMRVDAFVPRINKALAAARDLGMPVFLCPSDVVDNYVGFPQRERVF